MSFLSGIFSNLSESEFEVVGLELCKMASTSSTSKQFKKTKRECKFTAELQKEYTYMRMSNTSSLLRCNICGSEFSIASGGKNDIVRHIKSDKHKQKVAASIDTTKLDSFFRKVAFGENEKKLAISEAVMAFHTICHNQSFRSMDCTSRILQRLFDSKFACARTKCEAIITNVLCPFAAKEQQEELSKVSFVSIYSDASNKKDIKLFPTLVRYFNCKKGLRIRLLDLVSLPGENSVMISESILQILRRTDLLDKVVGFCADNANTNFGGLSRSGTNNVFARLNTELKQSIIGVGCSAHIIHNTIQTAADLLPVDLENIIVKIYSHFYIFTVRVEKLKEFCCDAQVEYSKLLGFCKTRWLALLPAIERVLKIYEALKSYFLSLDKCPNVLKHFFEDPKSELWLMFLHNQSSLFHNAILQVEGDNKTIMEIHNQIASLKFKLKERMEEQFISITMRQNLNNLEECGAINRTWFTSHIKNFYKNCLQYLEKWTSQFKYAEYFQWVCLQKSIEWQEVQKGLSFILENANDSIAENDLFDEISYLKKYVSPQKIEQWNDHACSIDLRSHCLFVLTMCLATSPVSANDYVGEVIPHDVELPIGGSVNITCRMNRSYFNDHNSSCLSFFRDEGNLKVPKEHIHVVDDSSIIFMVRNATEQTAQYSCKCHNKGVYITNIFVGTPPRNVTDFQCLGYDFSFMTCNFTAPPNKIYTDYKLKFSSSSPDYIYTCNLENGRQPSERICNITMDNNNYRIVYQYYNFELTASNSLGTLTQSIMIDQYNRIVPARPLVEVGNLTTNSVTLYWMVNKFSQYTHTDGLQYEIRLRPEKFDWFYINNNTILQKNKEQYKAEINNLQYPYRRYDFSVRVKTVRANKNDETMWSEPFEGIFYTRARRPERAPKMDVGSFYIDPTEKNIRLYWQQLAEYEENGPEFVYNITEVRRNGKDINIVPFHMDSTSATYEWDRTSHYQFKLKSQNQIGKSLDASTLEVHPSPKRSQQIEQIQVITKVYHNQTYTITWRQPSDMDNLRNFTLFWCISKMESQSQCKGTINFKHFDKYTTNHTTEPQNHTLNFAVSANYETYSTGIMWAMCTADGATDLTKMDPETTPISSNSIKVQWSTECLYMAILEGYNLTYCKVDNHVPEITGNCINTEKTISISKLAKEYIITELDPFTTYKISILMYSKLKIGPMSNPVIDRTTEDAPSPPRKLKKYNVTSDSVTLSWLPPKYNNGNLRYYTVWYKNEGTIVNNTSNDNGNELTFQLGDLSSYSDYKVYVTAHTVKSSGPSNDIHFKTLIGIPSPPLNFIMNRNDKELFFSWSPPKLPSGRVEFYEIRVTVRNNNESEILKTSRVVGHVCKMNIPCYDPKNSYIFDVRAVNLAERSEVDYHTFSKRDTSYFKGLQQGGSKKRRHSNAEINASIGASYQIHEPTEKNLRHRYERENLKLIDTAESTYVTQLYNQTPDEIQAGSDDDFICIGGEKEVVKILRQYNGVSQYKLFYSPWQNGPFFACSETKFSKLTMLTMVVIVVTMLLLVAVYYARKKYNKMSNIGLVIPEGLDDNVNVSKGVDNKIERDDIIRSGELFYENHRLLSKVGNDSGFLNSIHCLDKSSGYACSDLQDSAKSSQSTDSVELNDLTSCSYTSSPSHSPNANIREMSISEDISNPVIQNSVQLRPSENGYIKQIMMSNGYVQPQVLQKLQSKEATSCNGYTTLDAMGKPLFPQSSTKSSAPIADERNSYETDGANNINNKEISHPVGGNICGYVTHKQLSDFGRLQ